MHEPVPMRQGDIGAIVEMEKQCFATPWPREAFIAELANPAARYFVLRQDGRTVAYGGYWFAVDEGYITNIAVDPSFQGRGLGRKLLQALLMDAEKLGICRISLEVRASNLRAQGLYKSEGFVQCSVRKGYYPDNGEDAWIMLRVKET